MRSGPVILVDGRVIAHPTAGSRGIGRYVVSLVGALREAGARATVLVDDDDSRRAWTDAVPGVDVAHLSPRVLRDAPDDAWFLCTQLMLHPIPLDVVPRAVTEAGLRVVAVMYDVIPQRWPERYLVDPAARRMSQLRRLLAHTVDRFVAISTFAADTAAIELDVPRERFAVIGSAVDARFSPRAGAPTTRDVIANTGPDERKNTEGLIRAWSLIPIAVRCGRRLRIVCAAPDEVRARWLRLIDELGLDDVDLLGGIDDDELVHLYRSCELAVFPSFEEGFGLPIAEAAACGAPVVCSDTSSMPEVVRRREAVFDPHDVGDMALVIRRALTDSEFRSVLLEASVECAARWTWARVGADAVAALDEPRHFPLRRPAFEPRVAVVGRRDDELVAAWPSGSTVVTIDDTSGSDRRADGANVWGWGRYVRAHDFDAVVTRVTDSSQTATLTKMSRAPGHLWLDDGVEVPVFANRAHSIIVESPETASSLPDGPRVLVLRGTDRAARVREVADWVIGSAS